MVMSLAQILGIFSQIQVAGFIGRYKASRASQTLHDEGEVDAEGTTITQCLWQSSRISVVIPFVKLVAFIALIRIWIIWIR